MKQKPTSKVNEKATYSNRGKEQNTTASEAEIYRDASSVMKQLIEKCNELMKYTSSISDKGVANPDHPAEAEICKLLSESRSDPVLHSLIRMPVKHPLHGQGKINSICSECLRITIEHGKFPICFIESLFVLLSGHSEWSISQKFLQRKLRSICKGIQSSEQSLLRTPTSIPGSDESCTVEVNGNIGTLTITDHESQCLAAFYAQKGASSFGYAIFSVDEDAEEQ